ncbi:unnamed protein product [Cunninghamella blakesleeana]
MDEDCIIELHSSNNPYERPQLQPRSMTTDSLKTIVNEQHLQQQQHEEEENDIMSIDITEEKEDYYFHHYPKKTRLTPNDLSHLKYEITNNSNHSRIQIIDNHHHQPSLEKKKNQYGSSFSFYSLHRKKSEETLYNHQEYMMKNDDEEKEKKKEKDHNNNKKSLKYLTLDQKKEMISVIGKAFLSFATPTYRVEHALKLLAEKLSLDIAYNFTPDSIVMSIQQIHNKRRSKKRKQQKKNYNENNEEDEIDSNSTCVVNMEDGKDQHEENEIEEREKEKENYPYHKRRNIKKEKERKKSSSSSPSSSITTINNRDPILLLHKVSVWPDNHKIEEMIKIINRFYKDEIPYETCMDDINKKIINTPMTCSIWKLIFAFIILGFSASIVMFHGTWIDGSIAGLLGGLVGLLLHLASMAPIYAPVYDISACAICAIIGRALHQYCCFNASVIPALLILLPGYNMTVSVMEITSKHVITGTLRMAYALIYTFMLAYGLRLGSYLYSVMDPTSPSAGYCPDTIDISHWYYFLLFPIMSIGIGISYGSSSKQWFSQILCATTGFLVTYYLNTIITDSQILGAISAFVVGVYGHLALKITGEPPISPISVGITLLVPGSIGVKSVYAMLHNHDTSQSTFALQMLNIAIGLAVGLIASSMIIYPSGKKRSLYISL